jgi:hypothetical protein
MLDVGLGGYTMNLRHTRIYFNILMFMLFMAFSASPVGIHDNVGSCMIFYQYTEVWNMFSRIALCVEACMHPRTQLKSAIVHLPVAILRNSSSSSFYRFYAISETQT